MATLNSTKAVDGASTSSNRRELTKFTDFKNENPATPKNTKYKNGQNAFSNNN